MLAPILRIVAQVLAGVGVAKLADKVAPDKVPGYPAEGVAGGLTGKKILFFAAAVTAGVILVKKIGKMFNIKLLK